MLNYFCAETSKWVEVDCLWVEDAKGNRYCITQKPDVDISGVVVTKVEDKNITYRSANAERMRTT